MDIILAESLSEIRWAFSVLWVYATWKKELVGERRMPLNDGKQYYYVDSISLAKPENLTFGNC